VAKLNDYGFVFVHVKAADSLGEDGNPTGKRDFITKCDKSIPILMDVPDDVLIVVTADHSTPCEMKAHSADPVPIIFHNKSARIDKVEAFNERACAQGNLGFLTGLDVMPQVQNLLGKLHLVGA